MLHSKEKATFRAVAQLKVANKSLAFAKKGERMITSLSAICKQIFETVWGLNETIQISDAGQNGENFAFGAKNSQ